MSHQILVVVPTPVPQGVQLPPANGLHTVQQAEVALNGFVNQGYTILSTVAANTLVGGPNGTLIQLPVIVYTLRT